MVRLGGGGETRNRSLAHLLSSLFLVRLAMLQTPGSHHMVPPLTLRALSVLFYLVQTHKRPGVNGLWSGTSQAAICICVKCRISIFTLLWAGAIKFS